MAMHGRYVCKHGTLIKQCRCRENHNEIIVDECPRSCPHYEEKSKS